MGSAIAGIRHEWQQFRHDSPGARFRNHHARMRHHSPALVAARIAAAVVLLAAGVVLLFVPGPGVVVIAFGLGVLAGRSKRLAGALDRAEPIVRGWCEAAQHGWRLVPRWARVILMVVVVAGLAAAGYAGWRILRA